MPTEQNLNEQAKERIKFLENLIKSMYQTKIIVKENGVVENKLSPSELPTLITAEKELFKMKKEIEGAEMYKI